MKYLLCFIFILPLLVSAQDNRVVIDSIHSDRLCIEYPGLVAESEIIEEFQTAKYVFTGKVIEIISKERMEAADLGEDGKPIDFQPKQHFWYVLEVSEQFKGKSKKKITVYSRIFSTISPLLMLDKEYLIYAQYLPKNERTSFEKSQYLYIHCNGRSMHLKYASDDITVLRKLKKK